MYIKLSFLIDVQTKKPDTQKEIHKHICTLTLSKFCIKAEEIKHTK